MSALTLLIIRHAEKPGEDWPGPGLTVDGTDDKESLVIRGWQRAGSWSALFGAGLATASYPAPQVIYAANPDPQGEGAGDGASDGKPAPDKEVSQRPFETVTPLSARLGLTTNITWAKGDEKHLVKDIEKLSGIVLVCWEHKAIIDGILPELEKDGPIPGAPTKWNGKRYDVVLRFDRATPTAPWQCQQLRPQLLSGDPDTPLGD